MDGSRAYGRVIIRAAHAFSAGIKTRLAWSPRVVSNSSNERPEDPIIGRAWPRKATVDVATEWRGLPKPGTLLGQSKLR